MSVWILYKYGRAVREFSVAFQHQQSHHFSHPVLSVSSVGAQSSTGGTSVHRGQSPRLHTATLKVMVGIDGITAIVNGKSHLVEDKDWCYKTNLFSGNPPEEERPWTDRPHVSLDREKLCVQTVSATCY